MAGLWPFLVDSCRLLSVCFFLICSLTFTWYSFASLMFLLGSLYLLDRNKYEEKKESSDVLNNPYERKHRVKSEELLPPAVKQKYINEILDFVLYDVENCQTLENFNPIKSSTHCSFALMSKLWGARDYNHDLSLEANVERSIPALIKFLITGESLHLDGFVFELPGKEFSDDVEKFGQGVRRVLKCLSDHDPFKYHCMNKSIISGRGWCFELCGIPIFVTTFSPCYPSNHSRYAFGTKSGFILLQPMYSFVIHDIGFDTPITNWDNPKTMRDRIRVAYKENGRPYHIRDTTRYPMSHDIVKPLVEGPGNILEWWKEKGAAEENEGEDITGEFEEKVEHLEEELGDEGLRRRTTTDEQQQQTESMEA